MSTSIVLTVVSEDRPGIVEALSETLAQYQGNWSESSMMSLAGQFAGILLVSVPDNQVEPFLAGLDALQSRGIRIVAQRSAGDSVPELRREVSLDLVGQDRAGIVHDITEVLSRHRASVQELETTVESASMSGESLFRASARIFIPGDVRLEHLQDELEKLANELMVDISLEG
ncbi:MAG: ACT domain-containing protein [Xanthomonadales bacterium]|nr:ACT domain-containing protein [Xanthomonadales bacterium]